MVGTWKRKEAAGTWEPQFGLLAHNHDDLYLDQSEADALYSPLGHGHSHAALTDLSADDHLQYLRTDGTRLLTGDLNLNNNELVFSDAGTGNVDHIWHDDTGNVFHFVSDGASRALGNSTLRAGVLTLDKSATNLDLGLAGSGNGPYTLGFGNDITTDRFLMQFRTSPQSLSFENSAGRVLAEWPLSGSPAMLLNRISGQPSIKSLEGFLIMESNGNDLRLNNYIADNVIIATGGGSVGIGTATPSTGVDVTNGPLRLRGGQGSLGVNLEIQDTNPEIRFTETDTGYNWWFHVNSGYFYILRDSSGSGSWNTPHPMQTHITSEWTKIWNAVTMYSTGRVDADTFRAGNGTYSAPTYSFTGSTNTGMYRDTSLSNTPIVIAVTGLRNFILYPSGTPVFPGHPTTSSSANTYMSSSGTVFRSTSSRRYKKNIRPAVLDDVRSKLRGVNPVSFEPDHPPRPGEPIDPQPDVHVGWLAEDVAAALGDDAPLFVGYDDEGQPDWIMYDRFVVPLLAQVNELTDRVEALEGAA